MAVTSNPHPALRDLPPGLPADEMLRHVHEYGVAAKLLSLALGERRTVLDCATSGVWLLRETTKNLVLREALYGYLYGAAGSQKLLVDHVDMYFFMGDV